MITFRSGLIPEQGTPGPRGDLVGERPRRLLLSWPEWAIVGNWVIGSPNRYYSAKIRGGSRTQVLGSDPSTMSFTLKFVPYLRGEISGRTAPNQHWMIDLNKVLALKGQWVDIFWGNDGLGEWLIVDVTTTMGAFGVDPLVTGNVQLDPGAYPKEVVVQFRAIADSVELSNTIIVQPPPPAVDEDIGV